MFPTHHFRPYDRPPASATEATQRTSLFPSHASSPHALAQDLRAVQQASRYAGALGDDIPEAAGDNLVDWGSPPDFGPVPQIVAPSAFRLDDALRRTVPSIITFIWIGGNRISGRNYNNLLHAAQLNPGATVNVYVDSDDRHLGLEALAMKSGLGAGTRLRQCANVRIVQARDSEFGHAVSDTHRDAYALYERCMKAGRYAMACDVLRCMAVLRDGGVYVDADDEMSTPIDFHRLGAAPDEILHDAPCTIDHRQGVPQSFFPSSPFAANPGCAMLHEMLDRMGFNYREYLRLEQGPYKPAFCFEDTIPYYEIHRMCGPGVFTEVLCANDPRSSELLTLQTRSAGDVVMVQDGILDHVPFADATRPVCAMEMGADHSWDASAAVSPFPHLAQEEPEDTALPDARGLRKSRDGRCFIRAEGRTYRVAPDGGPERWTVIDSAGRHGAAYATRAEVGTWALTTGLDDV